MDNSETTWKKGTKCKKRTQKCNIWPITKNIKQIFQSSLTVLHEFLKKVLEDMVTSENVQEKIKSALPISPELVAKQIEGIVDSRLEELTPKMVKDIIQKMIRMHLGWLVVWGGIFGGIIGLVASYM